MTTKTGQNVGPILGGLNLRFGIEANGSSYNAAEYGPAVNVRKGAIPDKGNASKCPTNNKITYSTDPTADQIMGLPRDNCFASSSCTLMGGRMGNGNWDLTDYWAINHGGAAVPADLWDGTAANEPTRYEVYQYEIDNNLVSDVSGGGESGSPQSGMPPAGDRCRSAPDLWRSTELPGPECELTIWVATTWTCPSRLSRASS